MFADLMRDSTSHEHFTIPKEQLEVFKELFGLRRKGMGYLRTHMGQILHGRQLSESNF